MYLYCVKLLLKKKKKTVWNHHLDYGKAVALVAETMYKVKVDIYTDLKNIYAGIKSCKN